MQIVHLKSSLSQAELLEMADIRLPEFQAISGLIQKYYVRKPADGEYAGVYIWDSMESLIAFRETDLAKSIPTAYKVTEPPVVEVGEVMISLRD